MSDANSTGTLEHIAINPTCVSNAEGPTSQIAPSKRTRRRNVPCVAGTTRLTTKAVNTTTTLSKATTHTEPPSKFSSITHGHIRSHHNSPQPPQQQQRSYAEVVRNDAQQAEELLSAIKVFLEDFKGLFAQLLHQNSLIINMLSTLLNNKPH